MSEQKRGGGFFACSGMLGTTNSVLTAATLVDVLTAIEQLIEPQDKIASAMRKEGFDPGHDWCLVPASLREAAGPSPPKYLRFSPYIDGAWFMRNPAPNANSSANSAG